MADHPKMVPGSVVRFLLDCSGSTTLTEIRKRQSFRLSMMLQNGSPRALRLSEMYDRHEISGDQLLEMVWDGRGINPQK